MQHRSGCCRALPYLQGQGNALLGEHGGSQRQVLELAAGGDGKQRCRVSRGTLRGEQRWKAVPATLLRFPEESNSERESRIHFS